MRTDLVAATAFAAGCGPARVDDACLGMVKTRLERACFTVHQLEKTENGIYVELVTGHAPDKQKYWLLAGHQQTFSTTSGDWALYRSESPSGWAGDDKMVYWSTMSMAEPKFSDLKNGPVISPETKTFLIKQTDVPLAELRKADRGE